MPTPDLKKMPITISTILMLGTFVGFGFAGNAWIDKKIHDRNAKYQPYFGDTIMEKNKLGLKIDSLMEKLDSVHIELLNFKTEQAKEMARHERQGH